jgi:hypothetical protein
MDVCTLVADRAYILDETVLRIQCLKIVVCDS